MKKYLLTLGLVAFLLTSCCDKQNGKENCENNCKNKHEQCDKHEHECDHHGQAPKMCPGMMANMEMSVRALANWENLDETQKAEAINMAKANVEKLDAIKAQMENCNKHEGECKNHEGECNHHEGECKNHKGECKNHEGK